jgi:hypothetical protein
MADDHHRKRRGGVILGGTIVGISAVVAVLEEVGNRASGVWTVEHVAKWVPQVADELGPKAGMEASIAVGVVGVLLLAGRSYVVSQSEDRARSRLLHHVRGLGIIALGLAVFLAFSLPHAHHEPPKTAEVHHSGTHHKHHKPTRKAAPKQEPSEPSATGLTAEASQTKAPEPQATTASCGCKQAGFSAPNGDGEEPSPYEAESEPESKPETETQTTTSQPPGNASSSSSTEIKSTVESSVSSTTPPATSAEQSQSESQSSSSSSASSSASTSIDVSEG